MRGKGRGKECFQEGARRAIAARRGSLDAAAVMVCVLRKGAKGRRGGGSPLTLSQLILSHLLEDLAAHLPLCSASDAREPLEEAAGRVGRSGRG